MLKIGVVGSGHLGKIHIRLLKEIPTAQLVGFYDHNAEAADAVEKEFGIRKFNSYRELLNVVDAIDIVVPTVAHYECAAIAIKESKHIFIEKPLANTVAEGKKLFSLVNEADIKGQVGHVERFNPAFLAAKDYFNQPMFIETHRLAEFNPRG